MSTSQHDKLNFCVRGRDSKCKIARFEQLVFGKNMRISFNRTLRIPEDGKNYPLPAGMGKLPIHRVEDFAKKVPGKWLKEGGYFIPLYQREAMYIEFEGPKWHPSIAKICVGRINAINGENYTEQLHQNKQDYVLIPEQRWLDGINSGNGLVRQFVAMPLGEGYTVEEQVTDEGIHGGFQLIVYRPVKGIFPERDPEIENLIKYLNERKQAGVDWPPLDFWQRSIYKQYFGVEYPVTESESLPTIRFQLGVIPAMGIAAGGSIKQSIIPSIYEIETWDLESLTTLNVHIVNSEMYQKITGQNAPPSPITQEDYLNRDIPWFSHYNDKISSIAGATIFKRILGVSAIDKKRGIKNTETTIPDLLKDSHILKIRTPDSTEMASEYRNRAHKSAAASLWKTSLAEITKAIDLDLNRHASDFALRCCCNYHLGNFNDGEIDGSIGIQIDSSSTDSRTWRACCRLGLKDISGLSEDTQILAQNPATKSFALEMMTHIKSMQQP